MINFEIKNKTYKCRTNPSEISLKEFAKISAIQSGDGEHVEKWLQVLDIVSDSGLVNEIGIKGLAAFITEFQSPQIGSNITKEIEVNGRTYVYNDDPSAKAIQTLERFMVSRKDYAAHVFAVVYEDAQLTHVEHQDKAHIEFKAKLFGEQITADIAIPVIVDIAKIFVENTKAINDGFPMATA